MRHSSLYIAENGEEMKIWCCAVLLFCINQPFFLWHIIPPFLLVVLFLFLSVSSFSLKYKYSFSIFCILYFYIGARGNSSIYGYLGLLCVAMYLLLDRDYLAKILYKFSIVYSVLIFPSIIVYLIHLCTNIFLPTVLIEPLNSLKEETVQYEATLFLVLQYYISPSGELFLFPRFSGYFDEPGVVGTISSILLMCTKYDLKNKFNIPIFISGLLSFSFYFYIVSACYFLFFYKNFKVKIVLLLVMICILYILFDNDFLYKVIFQRFIVEDGGFTGDNRTSESFDLWFNNFLYSSEALWGIGKEGLLYNSGGASYKDIIVQYGLVFFVCYILFYGLFAFKYLGHNFKALIVALFLFVTILYQRPFIENFSYSFFFISFPFLIRKYYSAINANV